MKAQEYQPPIHRIDVAQFHRMLEARILTEDDRVELIDGEMRDMPPIGPTHSLTITHISTGRRAASVLDTERQS